MLVCVQSQDQDSILMMVKGHFYSALLVLWKSLSRCTQFTTQQSSVIAKIPPQLPRRLALIWSNHLFLLILC